VGAFDGVPCALDLCQPATGSGDADRDPEEDEAEPVAQLAWERPSERGAQVERHERVELVELLVGGVEAGMIAALIGFGVAGGIAIVAVLAYRAFAFCMPLVPGAVTHFQLVAVHGRQHADRRATAVSRR
jgi:hypothetical protein